MVRPLHHRSEFGRGERHLEPVDLVATPASEFDFVAAVEERAAQRRAALAEAAVEQRGNRRLSKAVACSIGVIVLAAVVAVASIVWLREGRQWLAEAAAMVTPGTAEEAPQAVAATSQGIETVEAMGDADEEAGLPQIESAVIAPVSSPATVIEMPDGFADGTAMSVNYDGPPVPREKPDPG